MVVINRERPFKTPQPPSRASWLPPRKSISKKLRQKVFDKCGGRCGYCGGELAKRWCVDHMHAHFFGGVDEIENLMPACFPCNNLKHSHSVEFFRSEIADQVRRAREYSVNYRTAERFGLVMSAKVEVIFYFETLATPPNQSAEEER